eukprot:1530984-Rhodomonas_salina.2
MAALSAKTAPLRANMAPASEAWSAAAPQACPRTRSTPSGRCRLCGSGCSAARACSPWPPCSVRIGDAWKGPVTAGGA